LTSRRLKLVLVLPWLCACGAWLSSSATPARADATAFAADVVRVDTDPKVDGTIDDPLWQKATHIELTWDYQFRRPASEKTDAYIMCDAHFLYVAIVAQQSEPITATLHTNDVALAADDLVRVYLWPGGDHGFEYFFVATPIGTHNEFSSENSAFAPAWTAVGKRTATGYIITMRIPLNVMRGDGRSTWRLQVERAIHITGQDYVWAHDPSQNGVDNSTYVGYLNGMTVARSNTRTKPRIGVYTLGQIASSSAGGDTSHMGADIAWPITETSSFFSTLHPDYSNVDLDQQTISPTAFPRQFSEVRPFFTQGGNFYNNFNCNDCVDYPFLYTPAIPTPREGYAVEGVQGLANFSAFESIGKLGRADNAETLTWQTQDKHVSLNAMRFGTDCTTNNPFPCEPAALGGTPPGYHDSTLLYQITEGNRHNSSFYFTGGGEHGTFVSDPNRAQFREWGINLFTQKFGFFPAYHDIGAQYAPTDQFIQTTDVHGPSLFVNRTWDNAPTSLIRNFTLSQDIQHYRNGAGQLDLADAFSQIVVNTKNQFQVQASTGYQYFLIGSYGSTINQNGVLLSYGKTTSAPTTITYNIGRFGPGYLRSTTRLATLRTGPRATLTLEGDNTNQQMDSDANAPGFAAGPKEVQWLERASFAYQVSPQSSVALGVRRIIGTSPFVVPPEQTFCPPRHNFPGCYVNESNVSFAYYRHVGQDELYVVYGDPNNLYTLPAFIVKYVHYFGAQKGT
jgi:hypothetical protein